MRILVLALMIGCGSDAVPVESHDGHPAEAKSHEADAEAKEEHAPAHWGYEHNGPDKWASLDEKFHACADGKNQSPVALVSADAKGQTEALKLAYSTATFDVVNNGHTVQMNVEAGKGSLEFNAHSFELKQGHFHDPSEHTLNGEQFPMELHLVHLDKSGKIAVVGVPIRVGAENELLKGVFAALPKKAGDTTKPEGTLDLAALVPKETAFIQYSGSLTTPPCTEGVQWLFLETPIELSDVQVKAFSTLIGKNARPTLPLNEREIGRTEKLTH